MIFFSVDLFNNKCPTQKQVKIEHSISDIVAIFKRAVCFIRFPYIFKGINFDE
jgi:hypothetical protein